MAQAAILIMANVYANMVSAGELNRGECYYLARTATVYATIVPIGEFDRGECYYFAKVSRVYATAASVGSLERLSCSILPSKHNIQKAFTQPIVAVMEKDESFVVTRKFRRNT